jgi:GNAT superfamily N-acetyltransferase
MEVPQLRQLPDQSRPLLNKFYRAHRSHMRAPAGARYWVAQHVEIIAGLCLTGVDGGNWLTAMLVAPSHRNQGLATRLVAQALAACEGPVWLFCEPGLASFYKQLSFSETTALPESLALRLQRYNQHKKLVALCHDKEQAA